MSTIAIYFISPRPPHNWCFAPEFFVLIASHCSTQIWRIRYGGSWSIYFLGYNKTYKSVPTKTVQNTSDLHKVYPIYIDNHVRPTIYDHPPTKSVHPTCNWWPAIENRIYREELKESLGMNFFSPFQPEREFKVYKSCKCSQSICSRVH